MDVMILGIKIKSDKTSDLSVIIVIAILIKERHQFSAKEDNFYPELVSREEWFYEQRLLLSGGSLWSSDL